MFDITVNLIDRNHSDNTLKPEGVVIHETAAPGATAMNIRNAFQRSAREASAHFAIDWDSIVAIVPTNEKAWHAGTYPNAHFVGIEMCHPTMHNPVQFSEVLRRTVWLTVKLLKDMGITKVTKDNVMSHDEARKRWGGTHTDPTGYFLEYGYSMDMFRTAIQITLNKEENKVDKVVLYANTVDKRAAEYVADYYECVAIDQELYNALKVNAVAVYGVGGGITVPCTVAISGKDRYDTVIQVLKHIGKLPKTMI